MQLLGNLGRSTEVKALTNVPSLLYKGDSSLFCCLFISDCEFILLECSLGRRGAVVTNSRHCACRKLISNPFMRNYIFQVLLLVSIFLLFTGSQSPRLCHQHVKSRIQSYIHRSYLEISDLNQKIQLHHR